MTYPKLTENDHKRIIYQEFRQLFARKKGIINNIELIDGQLHKLGLSNEVLEKAKFDYFSIVIELKNQINDVDQLNIYILNILKEHQKAGEKIPTEDAILSTIADLLEERT